MHRTALPAPSPARPLRPRLARRLAQVLTATVVATGLVAGAAPAQAATSGTPIGNFESATAVTGGIKVRGWAWDPNTTRAVAVRLTVGSTTTTVSASGHRPDVAKVFPAAGTLRGFETVLPLPVGTHRVCATAVNVGSGSNKVFPCRTATVTTASTASTTSPISPTSTAPVAQAATTSSSALTWAPPALTSPTTLTVTSTYRDLRLAAGRDYVVRMPSYPLEAVGGLVISGGRNVVLIGGEIRISRSSTLSNGMRGLYLKGQTGTVHVEGLKITGGALAEGINLDQRYGATVQLQNIRVDTVHGSQAGHHADVLQTWAGPKVLRVDKLTGTTTYQGMFLLPMQFHATAPAEFDLRRVNLHGLSGSGYLFWRDNGSWPIRTSDVWVAPSPLKKTRGEFLWAKGSASSTTWDAVTVGTPSTGDFVPAGAAGIGYVSPGYSPTAAG